MKQLLTAIEKLLHKEKQLRIDKGEHFNVFSILHVENAENKTHSNFIGELLNPQGSHELGTLFLNQFLKELGLTEYLDSKSAKLTIEKYIGPTNLEAKKGGRIDIFLEDAHGNSISIENKIYAGDQPSQIERYYKYNSSKNKVLYLTLNGTEPSEGSKGDLNSKEHFTNISYQTDIVKWLKSSLILINEYPVVRATIEQYIHLIQKLTNTMSDYLTPELTENILGHFEAAKIIADNFYGIQKRIGEKVKEELRKSIENDERFSEFSKPSSLDNFKNTSSLWLTPKKNKEVSIGIESFSGLGHFDGRLFIGLWVENSELLEQLEKWRWKWCEIKNDFVFEGIEVSFNKPDLLEFAHDSSKRKKVIQYLKEEILAYAKFHEVSLKIEERK